MALTQKTDIVTEGQGQLVSQFKRQPNMLAFLAAYLEQIQDIEDAAFSLLAVPQSPGTQTGDPLDLIGKIVGQDREGRTDAVLQKWILARLIVNRSSGIVDDILTALGLIAPDNTASLEEYFPASFVVRLADAFSGDATAVADIVREIRAAGVGASLEYWTMDPVFVFSSSDSEEISSQGFGEIIIPANGYFTDWTADDPDDWTVTEIVPPASEVSQVGSGQAHGGAGTGSCNLFSTAGIPAAIRQTVGGLEVGEQYDLVVTVSYASGSLKIWDVPGDFSETITTVGEHHILFTPSNTDIDLQLIAENVAQDWTIDSIEIYSIAGGLFAAVETI